MRNRQDLYFMGEFCSGYARSVVWLLFAGIGDFCRQKKPIKKQKSAYLRAAKAVLLWVCNRESGPQGPLL